MFVEERLSGLLYEFGIGEEQFVDWFGKTARHRVFNESASV